MTETAPAVAGRVPAIAPALRQWLTLVAGSSALIVLMRAAGLPGAWLLGPMIAGIVVSTGGGTIRVAPGVLVGGQAIIGCMVAGLLTRPVLASFARRWPIFLVVTLSTLLAAAAIGRLLTRRRLLPGTTGIWGVLPGAATAMALVAEEHGGDPRLVAFMQYVRVILVAVLASLVGRIWIGGAGPARPGPSFFPALRVLPLVETLAVAVVGMALARRLRIPSGALIGPMMVGAILNAAGVVEIELPRWLLAATYAALGWAIGLRFTRGGLAHAARSFPMILASIAALIAWCGAVGWALHRLAGIDLLTAYLATSPGGLDAAAAIAASTTVDLPLVMGMQTVRAVVVLLFGPALARFLSRLS